MKIAVLDGYTTNPGDISWAELERLGELTVYDYTPPELVAKRCEGCEAVISNKTVLDEKTLSRMTDVKYIGLMSTGYNVVDTAAAKSLGITVTNVPSYSTDAVAQHVFAFILDYCNRVSLHSQAVHSGEWSDKTKFCFWKKPLYELSGKTLGIIGFGRIGQRTAEIAAVFGMRVVYTSRSPKQCPFASSVTLNTLLGESDFISIHCPLTEQTAGLINYGTIEKMKNGAVLINTSRGQLLNDADVAAALLSGKLSAVCIDVMTTEPPAKDNPLLSCENCVITPHIAWAAKETRERLMSVVAENLKGFTEGRTVNKVN